MNNIHGARLNRDMLEPERLGLRRLARPRLPPGQRSLVADRQPEVRPRRQRLHDRLVRQEPVPPQRRQRPRPHQRADLQGQLRRDRGDPPVDLRSCRARTLVADADRAQRVVCPARAPNPPGARADRRRCEAMLRTLAAPDRGSAGDPASRSSGPARRRRAETTATRSQRRLAEPGGDDPAWTIQLATEQGPPAGHRSSTGSPSWRRPIRRRWSGSTWPSALQRLPLGRALGDPRRARRPRRGRRRSQPAAHVLVRRRAAGRGRRAAGGPAGVVARRSR